MGDKQSPGANSDRACGSKPADQACPGPQEEAKKIQIGMVVEADQGDLGQEDISEAKVTDVIHDQAGDVETVVVEKGTVFRKQLEIPVERILSVGQGAGGVESDSSPNKVIFSASEKEVETLTATGSEAFPPEDLNSPKCEDDLLDLTGKTLPTDVGLRRLEEEAIPDDRVKISQVLGPGLLSGMAGNDASAVASYSLDGAQNGYGHLWLMLLSTPLLQAVQFACAKIGRVQQKGLAEILRDQYGRKVAVSAALLLIVANIALIAADLVAREPVANATLATGER